MSPAQVPSALVTDRSPLALPVARLSRVVGSDGDSALRTPSASSFCFVGQIELEQAGTFKSFGTGVVCCFGGEIDQGGRIGRGYYSIRYVLPSLLCDLS